MLAWEWRQIRPGKTLTEESVSGAHCPRKSSIHLDASGSAPAIEGSMRASRRRRACEGQRRGERLGAVAVRTASGAHLPGCNAACGAWPAILTAVVEKAYSPWTWTSRLFKLWMGPSRSRLPAKLPILRG